MLHTMIRVKDLEVSVRFYTEQLGMTVLRRLDDGEGKTIAFVGYGSELDHSVLELSHSSDRLEDVKPDFFGHVAIGVRDIEAVFDSLVRAGVRPRRKPRTVSGETIAAVEDPDGYKIELIEMNGWQPDLSAKSARV